MQGFNIIHDTFCINSKIKEHVCKGDDDEHNYVRRSSSAPFDDQIGYLCNR